MSVMPYRGPSELEQFHRDVEAVLAEGDQVISPGGAAILLGVSRQYVWELVKTPTRNVRAWCYYDGIFRQRLEIAHISVRDLVRAGVRSGRVQSINDLGFRSPEVQRILDYVMAEGVTSQPDA